MNPFLFFPEAIILGGIVLQFWALLAPVPWFSNDTSASLLSFVPYVPPEGYQPPNPCGSYGLSNHTVSVALPKQLLSDGSSEPTSKIALWMGPLGSCSRDADGRVFCTKASFTHPQYNMTWIQPNSVFYPKMMKSALRRDLILTVLILGFITFAFFTFASAPYHNPPRWINPMTSDNPRNIGMVATWIGVFIGILGGAQFILNFFIHVNAHSYNSIDNFYLPAQCGTERQLKPGVLLRAVPGKSYKMVWTAWCLIYLFGLAFLVYRVCWISGSSEKYIDNLAAKAAEREAKKVRKEGAAIAADNEKAESTTTDSSSLDGINKLGGTYEVSTVPPYKSVV